MSTNARGCRALVPTLAVAFLAACTPHVSTQIAAVCLGQRVGDHVGLVIDSVGPAAANRLGALVGHEFDLSLTLLNGNAASRCEDRTGEAVVSVGELPDALAHATAGRRGARWWIEGTRLLVNLNPGAADNNLIFDFPLGGGPGRWSLSTLAGPVASGRLLLRGG